MVAPLPVAIFGGLYVAPVVELRDVPTYCVDVRDHARSSSTWAEFRPLFARNVVLKTTLR